MAINVIDYECVAPDHTATAEHPDKLTVHQGHWAFCRFDAQADGHDWKPTGGVELQQLMRHVGLAIVSPPLRIDQAKERVSSAR